MARINQVLNFFIATVIVIEMVIRINQTLVKKFQTDFDEKISTTP